MHLVSLFLGQYLYIPLLEYFICKSVGASLAIHWENYSLNLCEFIQLHWAILKQGTVISKGVKCIHVCH